jgi:hypothetical protein
MPRKKAPKIVGPVVLLTLHFRREGEPLDGPAWALTVGSREEIQPAVDSLMQSAPRPVPASFRLYESRPLGLEVERVPSEYMVRVGGAPVHAVFSAPTSPAKAPRKKRKDAGQPRGGKRRTVNGTLPGVMEA